MFLKFIGLAIVLISVMFALENGDRLEYLFTRPFEIIRDVGRQFGYSFAAFDVLDTMGGYVIPVFVIGSMLGIWRYLQ